MESPISEKLIYLRTYVKGKALEIVKSYPFAATNYIKAWDALRDYYENKRHIVQTHLSGLFSVKPIKNESATYLTMLMTGVFTPIYALKEIG